MRIAAVTAQQRGIADVVQRRADLLGRQRAVGGSGEPVKCHEFLSVRGDRTFPGRRLIVTPASFLPQLALQVLEKLHETPGNTNVTKVTELQPVSRQSGTRKHRPGEMVNQG